MKNLGFVYAITAAITWGLVYTIDQKILMRVSPLSLLFIDSLLAIIITFPILMYDSSAIRTLLNSGKTNLALILLALTLTVAANLLIFLGIKNLGASTASIFEVAYPFFVVFFSFLLFRQTVSGYFAIGALLIFMGAVIIIKYS